MSAADSANNEHSSAPAWLPGSGPVNVNFILTEAVDEIDSLFQRPSNVVVVPTGFNELDEKTHGLHEGDLIIVGSRPGMGKTTFVLNLVESALRHSEKALVVFSTEMSAKTLVLRMLSSIGRVEQSKLLFGNMEEDDWPRLTSAINKLVHRKLFVDDDTSISLEKIRLRTRLLAQEQEAPGLIVVDGLQMMGLGSYGKGCRSSEIAEIVYGLKALAQEFKCPVVVTSHLDRNLESRLNKRPMCIDLSDSSAIEQVADVILFVYRDELYYPDREDKGIAEIIIGKQRLGNIGTVRLAFQGKYSRFENLPSAD